MSSPVQVKGTH